MEKILSEKDSRSLRDKGLLSDDEQAFLVGNDVIAENVLNKTRRRLDTAGILLETKRTLLKD